MKKVLIALGVTTLLAGPAMAQTATSTDTTTTTAPATTTDTFVTAQPTDMLSSNLIGLDITTGQKEDIGEIKDLVSEYVGTYPTELVSRLLDTLKRVGFHTATKAGLSLGKNDIVIPEQKQEILSRYEEMANEVEEQWGMGFISDEERK